MFSSKNAAGALAAGLVASAGLLLALYVGIVTVEHVISGLWLVGGLVVALALWGLVRGHLVRMPGPAPYARRWRPHSLEEIARTLDEFSMAPEADIRELVDYLVYQAAEAQSSDIHLVPYRDFTAVRYRVDGRLTDVGRLGAQVRGFVTSRLKVLAGAVTYVHDRPQDGRFTAEIGGREVDVRASLMPTLHGERVVLRLLERAGAEVDFESLGLSETQVRLFQGKILRPQGLIVLTGPTGSGKTTTIYCSLRVILEHNRHSSSIYTLEDPIEYDLMNINQTQIAESQGFTFASGLKNMLRQDPDVIMVGEIRDSETAQIAIQAGLTGHLIITTVHARQAAGVFERLVEMGVDRKTLASAMTLVVAQRLIRRLCPHCKRLEPATPGQEEKLGRSLRDAELFGPVGCDQCNGSGYSGRRGVFELLEVDERVARQVADRVSPDILRQDAAKRGTTTLLDNGLALALQGETSLDEILATLPEPGDR